MSLTFHADTHRYFWDHKPVPGVTSVLAAAGLLDFGGASEEVLAAARARGTAVHIACELDDKLDLIETSVDETIRPYLEAWRSFRSATHFVPIENERQVFDEYYRYAGTLDRTGRWNLGRTNIMLDIKTGAPQRATGPQTAAYARALVGAAWVAVPRYACYLQDDGRYNLVEETNRGDLAVFLAALGLYNWKGIRP